MHSLVVGTVGCIVLAQTLQQTTVVFGNEPSLMFEEQPWHKLAVSAVVVLTQMRQQLHKHLSKRC